MWGIVKDSPISLVYEFTPAKALRDFILSPISDFSEITRAVKSIFDSMLGQGLRTRGNTSSYIKGFNGLILGFEEQNLVDTKAASVLLSSDLVAFFKKGTHNKTTRRIINTKRIGATKPSLSNFNPI
jgi:hypothetical protein